MTIIWSHYFPLKVNVQFLLFLALMQLIVSESPTLAWRWGHQRQVAQEIIDKGGNPHAVAIFEALSWALTRHYLSNDFLSLVIKRVDSFLCLIFSTIFWEELEDFSGFLGLVWLPLLTDLDTALCVSVALSRAANGRVLLWFHSLPFFSGIQAGIYIYHYHIIHSCCQQAKKHITLPHTHISTNNLNQHFFWAALGGYCCLGSWVHLWAGWQ